MASNDRAAGKTDRAAKKQERAAQRAKMVETRAKREEARKEKAAASGRPARLCSLETVEVRKGNDGFVVTVNASTGRKSFTITPNEASQVLRDLETAIHVVRGQQ